MSAKKLHYKIYKKEMILSALRSMNWAKPKIDNIISTCNAYPDFLSLCVRTYRGSVSITKRIERVRSGNKLY